MVHWYNSKVQLPRIIGLTGVLVAEKLQFRITLLLPINCQF